MPSIPLTTMRKLKQICIALIALWSVVGAISAENPKMAMVDMQKLFKQYNRTAAAQERFNMEYATIQKDVNERIEVMNQMRLMLNNLQNQMESGTLTDEQKKKKESEWRLVDQERKIMKDQIKQFEKQERERVKRLMSASMWGLMREIRGRVVSHAEQQGYDFVFDKSGKNSNQVSYFIYLKDPKDITVRVLNELNQFAPSAEGK